MKIKIKFASLHTPTLSFRPEKCCNPCPALLTTPNVAIPPGQGDQIGRILAQWPLFTLGRFPKITKVAEFFGATLFDCTYIHKMYVLGYLKDVLGYILGDFFANSSGHPAPVPHIPSRTDSKQRSYVRGGRAQHLTRVFFFQAPIAPLSNDLCSLTLCDTIFHQLVKVQL
jgi:hypothetical protein